MANFISTSCQGLEPGRVNPHVINGGASVLVEYLHHIKRGTVMSRLSNLQDHRRLAKTAKPSISPSWGSSVVDASAVQA
jgi:hypothetical protein